MNNILKLIKNKHLRSPLILLGLIAFGFLLYKSYLLVDNYIADQKIQSYHWKEYKDKRIGVKFIAPDNLKVVLSDDTSNNTSNPSNGIIVTNMELTETLNIDGKHFLVENPDQDLSYSGPLFDGFKIDIYLFSRSAKKHYKKEVGGLSYTNNSTDLNGTNWYWNENYGGNNLGEKRYSYTAIYNDIEYSIHGHFPDKAIYRKIFNKIRNSITFTGSISSDVQGEFYIY